MSDEKTPKKEQTLQEKVESEFLNRQAAPKIQPSSKGPLKSLRTFQGDIEEILGKTGGSIASVAVAEQKRKEEQKKKEIQIEQKIIPEQKEEKIKTAPDPALSSLPQQASTDNFVYNTRPEQPESSETKNRFFFYLGSFLLIVGVVAIGAVYYIKSRDTTVSVESEKTIISYSQVKNMNIASSTRKGLVASIIQEKQELKLPVNSVLYLRTVSTDDTPIEVNKVVELLTPHMPSELVRSLDENYMVGIYSFDTNEPFIILTENDFGLSYSGMLKWEESMLSDLGEIFSISTSTENTFEDEALKNKDLRIIKNSNKETVLLYSFLDKNTILITSNENIFSAILGKYMTSKIAR